MGSSRDRMQHLRWSGGRRGQPADSVQTALEAGPPQQQPVRQLCRPRRPAAACPQRSPAPVDSTRQPSAVCGCLSPCPCPWRERPTPATPPCSGRGARQASSSFTSGKTVSEQALLHSQWHRRWVDRAARLSRYCPLIRAGRSLLTLADMTEMSCESSFLVLRHDEDSARSSASCALCACISLVTCRQ